METRHIVVLMRRAPTPGGERRHGRCGASCGVADAQQQCDQRPVGHQRRAALRQERRRQAGQRDQPGHAADDDEDLEAEREREPDGEQLAERRPAPAVPCLQPARDQDGVQHEQRHQSGEPELLAGRRDDEVGLGGRARARGGPAADPGAEDPARQPGRSSAWSDLVAGAVGVVERVRARPRRGSARGRTGSRTRWPPTAKSSTPRTIQPDALGGDVEHRHEHPEEQQRGAQVALEAPAPRGSPATPPPGARGRGRVAGRCRARASVRARARRAWTPGSPRRR